MKATLAWLCVVAVAAGCLQSPDPQEPFDEARQAVRDAAAGLLALDHDKDGGHADAKLHQGAHNVQLVGYSNGVDDTGDPNRIPPTGTFNEIALHGNLAYLSHTSADGTFGGFSVVDVSDPAQPKVVGRFAGQGGNDIELSEDGTLAFFVSQRNTVEQVAGGIQEAEDPGAGLPRGIYVVDTTDPTAPVLDSFAPLPYNGPHTITSYHHPNGNDYLVVCTYDLVTDPVTGAITGAAPVTQRLIVYLVAPNPTAGIVPGVPRVGLFPVAQYQEAPPAGEALVFPHDTHVGLDLQGRIVITVAYWDLGLRFLDFTHPPGPGLEGSLPTLPRIGSFSDFAPSAFNNMHLAKPFASPFPSATGGFRQITVAEPEIITAEHETGQVTFVDTTDPARPAKVSWWSLPPQEPVLGVTDLDFSPHNFDTWDGKVALTHYHGGVWVVDVSTPENLAEPKEVGFYMPAKPRTDSPVPQPDAWSVRVKDGLLYVTDEATGLYVLRYTGP